MNPGAFYTLDHEHNPIVTMDPLFYADWMQSHPDEVVLANTTVGLVRISTVFLGISIDSMRERKPLKLFETLTSSEDKTSSWNHRQKRYNTYDEAIAGHAAMVKSAIEAFA